MRSRELIKSSVDGSVSPTSTQISPDIGNYFYTFPKTCSPRSNKIVQRNISTPKSQLVNGW